MIYYCEGYNDPACPVHGAGVYIERHCGHCTIWEPCPPGCVLCAADKFYEILRRGSHE